MKKVYVNIAPSDWDHLVTKYPSDAKQVQLSNFTAGTKNIDTDSKGVITKRNGGTVYTTIPTPAKDLYEVIFADGSRHLLSVDSGNLRFTSGDGIETLVTAGYSAGSNFEFITTQDRAYFDNGVNSPQVYDKTASYGGVTYTVPQTKVMGAQTPATAPTFATDTAGGFVPAGAHTYKVTFQYYGFEESNGGPASVVHTVSNPNNTVNLTSIPIGGYGVTARKIYRDDNDSNYVLLGTITDNTTTIFTDDFAAGTTPIPGDNFPPPIFALIAHWLERVWVAKVPGDPYDLFFSEAGDPDIFPSDFNLTCNEQDPITGLVVYYGRLIVFNRNSMGQILGTTSDTFRYDHIEDTIGCIDNRSIQVRVVEGVPLLIWLSSRGFYSYDGNSVNYISDPIEDLVNLNIQQSLQQKGFNNQSSETDFLAGTSSNGIDLSIDPGFITTRAYEDGTASPGANPKRIWDDEGDWEGGSSKVIIATQNGTNTLKGTTRFNPDINTGTNTGTVINGSRIELPTFSFTGEVKSFVAALDIGTNDPGNFNTQIAVRIVPPRTGNISRVYGNFGNSPSSITTYNVQIQTESGGLPSGVAVSGGTGTISPNTAFPSTLYQSTLLTSTLNGGTPYWIVFIGDSSTKKIIRLSQGTPEFSGGSSKRFFPTGSVWSISPSIFSKYDFTTNPVALSGNWVSPIHDTFSIDLSGTGEFVYSAFVMPNSGTKAGIIVDASNDFTFSTFTNIINNPPDNVTSNLNVTLQNFRYWRLTVPLSTTDDRFTPSVGGPYFVYSSFSSPNAPTWISEAIDTTADSTVYNSLVVNTLIPSGTSLTTTIATSDDNITYTSFVSFGSHTVKRYAKIKLVFGFDTFQDNTPTVNSVIFTWTIVANFISSAINTNTTPSGWDVFAADFTAGGGTVQFQMRSASNLVALGAATFYNVTNGDFPNPLILPLQYTQWKVILTATADAVPEVAGVTITWFIGIASSIRPASIFTNNRYYMSAAELGQTSNNLVIELDLKGKWRIYKDVNVGTFSFFFNNPYYGSSTLGQIIKFLQGFQDQGANIPIDIRFKSLDFNISGQDNEQFLKAIDYIILQGRGTGASYRVYYSVDEGSSYTLLKYEDGTTSFTTTNDNKNFYVRFKADKSDSSLISGKTITIRITTNDVFDINVQGIKVYAWLWEFEPFLLT